MTVVVFNQTAFLARYPEFGSVDPTAIGLCFDEACLYCNNTDSSRVTDINMRASLLNMATAHIVALNFGTTGSTNNPAAPPTPLVGRQSSVSEGGVHVSVDMMSKSEAASWWNQTKYGAAFWRASASYRTMLYVPGSANVGPFFRVPRW
jgi:hypothetical protein